MQSKNVVLVEKKESERLIPMLVQTASQYQSSIHFLRDGKNVNVKSIMGMLNFELTPGSTIEIQVDGEDEDEAMSRLEEYLTTK